MANFPKKEADVVALAEQMVAGLTAHAADFPSVDVADLQTALTNYKSQRQTQENARSQAQIATVTKDERLDGLVELMKNHLKLSEVDVADDPEKLTEIGWSPSKQALQPLQAPGQPINLKIIGKDDNVLKLKWDKPAGTQKVTNYIIERCCLNSNQADNWAMAAISYYCRTILTNQPRGIKLEYRIKASNPSGQSLPSNTVKLTLE